MSGPRLRSDIMDAYVFRRGTGGAVELLQLRRNKEPLAKSWHPVMGHIEPGETAIECLWRELAEEIGLRRGDAALLGAWQLEQVFPFFLASSDEIVLSPRFCVEVAGGFEPVLDPDHDAARWAPVADADEAFLWPGQQAAVRELAALLERPKAAAMLRIYPA